MIDASRYTISVRKATIDGETSYEARVRELPDVSAYADTFSEAYDQAIDAIETLAAVAERKGKPFPDPYKEDESASGRVTLRLPKSVHARAVQQALDEAVSLNTYLVSIISEASIRPTVSTAVATSPAVVELAPNSFAGRAWKWVTFNPRNEAHTAASWTAVYSGGWVKPRHGEFGLFDLTDSRKVKRRGEKAHG